MTIKGYTQCILALILVFLLSINCKKGDKTTDAIKIEAQDVNLEEERYRPNFHFTPRANWMNDPNGMFYLNGIYHLYFQYYPNGNVWGPMHWGHATSKDLFHWSEQPIALYPDELGFIFSGSAVVDNNNSSGLGKEGIAPVVAFFTYHDMNGEKEGRMDFQSQAMAFSLDEGMTWTKYEENQVIPNPGIKDFRDPKVIWDENNDKWIMSLAAGNKIMFYSSKNLIDWNFESEFGEGVGAQGGVWECPDLFPLQVNNTEESKWVLLVSINPGGPNGGSATQYFIGDFDGQDFVPDDDFLIQLEKEKAVWLDYGRDNYAGVTWSNIPESDGRRIGIGWMSNWDYARDVPTYTWRSAMTIPRELRLHKEEGKYCVRSRPVKEFYDFVEKEVECRSIGLNEFNAVFDKNLNLNATHLELALKGLKAYTYDLSFYNQQGDSLTIGLDNTQNQFYIDRTASGKVDFSEKFAPAKSVYKLNKSVDDIRIQIVLDKTSVEVFVNDGAIVFTELFFPNALLDRCSLISDHTSFNMAYVKLQELKFQN